MTKHRSHSAAFKRQVAEEFLAGETLHALSQRRIHPVSTAAVIKRLCVSRYLAPANSRQQFIQPADRMLGDIGQDICQPGLRVDVVHLYPSAVGRLVRVKG